MKTRNEVFHPQHLRGAKKWNERKRKTRSEALTFSRFCVRSAPNEYCTLKQIVFLAVTTHAHAHTHTHTQTYTHSLYLSNTCTHYTRTHTFSLSLTNTRTLTLKHTCSLSLSLTNTRTHTHSKTHTCSLSASLSLRGDLGKAEQKELFELRIEHRAISGKAIQRNIFVNNSNKNVTIEEQTSTNTFL